jgi:hypothetical protein
MQTCVKCGFAAETNAKFCRQCGASLFADSDSTEAPTQHYGRQAPPPVPEPASSPFTSPMPPKAPPSIADTFAPDTGRLHNPGVPPPPMPYQQNPYPAPMYGATPPAPAAKSNWWKWALGVVLGSVLICGGCVSYGLYKAQEMGQGLQSKIEEAVKEAERQAGNANANKQAENVPPVIGPDGKPVPPPPPAPGSDNVSPDLAKLKYPNASQTTHTKVFGQEVFHLTSEDDFEAIKAFYQTQMAMGDPITETTSNDSKTAVFQKGQVMVTLNEQGEKRDITLIRSTLIPNLKEAAKP